MDFVGVLIVVELVRYYFNGLLVFYMLGYVGKMLFI